MYQDTEIIRKLLNFFDFYIFNSLHVIYAFVYGLFLYKLFYFFAV